MTKSLALRSVSSNTSKQISKNNSSVIILTKLTSSNSQANSTMKLLIQQRRRGRRKGNTRTKNQRTVQMIVIVVLKSALECAALTFSLTNPSFSNRLLQILTTSTTRLRLLRAPSRHLTSSMIWFWSTTVFTKLTSLINCQTMSYNRSRSILRKPIKLLTTTLCWGKVWWQWNSASKKLTEKLIICHKKNWRFKRSFQSVKKFLLNSIEKRWSSVINLKNSNLSTINIKSRWKG